MVPRLHGLLVSSGVKSGLHKKYKEQGDFIISWVFYYLNFCGVKAQDYTASDCLKF